MPLGPKMPHCRGHIGLYKINIFQNMVILHNILCQHTPLTPEVWSKDHVFLFEISCVANQIKGNETRLIILMSTEVEVNNFL